MVFTGHVHIYNYSVINGLNQIIAGGSGAPIAGTLEQGGFYHFFNVIVNGSDVDYRLIPLQNEVQLATQLLNQKMFIASISIAGKAIKNVPDHPMPHIIAAVGYKKIGKTKEFNNEKEILLSILKNKMDVNFRLGEFCFANNLNILSEFFFAKAHSLDNNSFKVLYHYAQLKEKQKKNVQAIAMYKKAYPLTDDNFLKKDIQERILKLSSLTKF